MFIKLKVCNKYRTSKLYCLFLFIALVYFAQDYMTLDLGSLGMYA